MIIKHHINKNDYCLSRSGHWIRNFTKPVVKPVDINDITPLDDMKLIIENEFKNSLKKYQVMEDIFHEKAIIIGDGYSFEESAKAIEALSGDVVIIGVNKAFAKWTSQRSMNYYVVNNPYQDCLYNYPQIITSWPKCIASVRTHAHFLEVYKGLVYTYYPTCGEIYSGPYKDNTYFIDDYRNPICAAIGLCYKFKVKKLMIMSALEMYKEERSGTMPVKGGLWTYPQQRIAHDLIDGNLYWMQKAKINVGYTNSGLDYEFATYINVTDLKRFFNDGQK
jgi:hypothetical protein